MAIPQRLTPDQQDAVNARARTSLVIAPAGSGKTEVLIRRIERLLDESPGESFRLLAVTFTVKASEELKSRVSRSVGDEAWRVDANTIHGFALDWLQRSGQAVGVSPDVIVYAEGRDCVDLLRRFLDSVEESGIDDRTLLDILKQINDLRTDLVKPSEAPNQLFSGSSFRLPELYEAYLTALDNAGGIDFPGMLVKLLDLFEADPAVLRRMQRTYQQLLVDEGQDLTHAQAELLRRIVGDTLELFVVADDRQSINGWAGGGMQWTQMLVGPNHKRFELQHNFRCATRILSLSRQVAHHFNPPRTDGGTPPGAPEGMLLTHEAEDSAEEARIVVNWVDGLVLGGLDSTLLVPGEEPRVAAEDIAVIARTRYGLDDVQVELRGRGYPVSIQVDSGSFLASSEARLFYALLEVRANGNNRPALRHIEEELFSMLGGYPEIAGAQYGLTDVLKAVSGTPIHRMVELVSRSTLDADGLEEIIGALRHGAYFPEPDLEQFVGWWLEYRASTALQDRNMGGFLRYLLRVQQTRPDQPGIRLMTTHRSKGLEFRAIAVVGLTQGAFPDYRELGEQQAIEAERRAFYVSITRASRALLLTWSQKRRTRYGERTVEPSQFLREAGLQV